MTGSAERALRVGADAILGRPLTDHETERMHKYVNLLLKWQKVQRLVGSSDPEWIVDNVLLDSLLFTRVLPTDARTIMDLGSGAGLPGIPVKIVSPELAMTLVESRAKRASFLSAVVRDLALGARVVNVRAEEMPAEFEGAFDAVVMRCVLNSATAMSVADRFVRRGGVVVASGPPIRPAGALDIQWVTVNVLGAKRLFAVRRLE